MSLQHPGGTAAAVPTRLLQPRKCYPANILHPCGGGPHRARGHGEHAAQLGGAARGRARAGAAARAAAERDAKAQLARQVRHADGRAGRRKAPARQRRRRRLKDQLRVVQALAPGPCRVSGPKLAGGAQAPKQRRAGAGALLCRRGGCYVRLPRPSISSTLSVPTPAWRPGEPRLLSGAGSAANRDPPCPTWTLHPAVHQSGRWRARLEQVVPERLQLDGAGGAGAARRAAGRQQHEAAVRVRPGRRAEARAALHQHLARRGERTDARRQVGQRAKVVRAACARAGRRASALGAFKDVAYDHGLQTPPGAQRPTMPATRPGSACRP